MKYVKIARMNVGGGYTQPLSTIGEAIANEFEGANDGDQIRLTLVEMTEEDYNLLPEFTGW